MKCPDVYLYVLSLMFIKVSTEEVLEKVIDNDKGFRIIDTEKGTVKGYKALDGDYYAFYGIPYADPPTGNQRFKSPKPRRHWYDTFEATRKVKCPQRGTGDEDCLVVNIFTPLNISKPLPVLVSIHGGSFIIGSGCTSGFTPLMNQNIVVVTINYRLGVLGFLCLGTEDAPGNAGLKDQVAALGWIKRNILNFGGDPEQVTIHGISAGGSSVEFLLYSELSAGLYKGAIIESGSALSVFSLALNPLTEAEQLGKAFGFPKTSDLKTLASYYYKVPSDELSRVNYEYYTNLTNGNFGFVPCVENYIKDVLPFITETPLNIISHGDIDRVPILYLFAKAEGLFLKNEEFNEQSYKDKMNFNFAEFVPVDLLFDDDKHKKVIAETIKEFYFENRSVSEETALNFVNFFGDYLILYPLIKSVQLNTEKSHKPIYLLEFSYKGNMGSSDNVSSIINLSGHGDIIKHAIISKPIKTEQDRIAVERVSKILANFVKFGKPIPKPTAILNITWPPVLLTSMTYLNLDNTLQILEDPYAERVNFWDLLYRSHRRRNDY